MLLGQERLIRKRDTSDAATGNNDNFSTDEGLETFLSAWRPHRFEKRLPTKEQVVQRS